MTDSFVNDPAVEVGALFVSPPSIFDLVPEWAALKERIATTIIADVASAFIETLKSVVATVSIPMTLASSVAHGNHWQRLLALERSKELKIHRRQGESDAELEQRRCDAARRSTATKMRVFVDSPSGKSTISSDTHRVLLDAAREPDLRTAAQQLILQGEVLLWSAFETLSRDLAELLLNASPDRITAVLSDTTAKQRVPAKLPMEELAGLGFDLSRRLGTLIVSQQDFSDIKSIRALMPPLLHGGAELAAALNSRELWNLSQRRHLIVHRRGIVDSRFVESMGAEVAIGEKLTIGPKQFEDDLRMVGAVGITMLSKACAGAPQQYVAADVPASAASPLRQGRG